MEYLALVVTTKYAILKQNPQNDKYDITDSMKFVRNCQQRCRISVMGILNAQYNMAYWKSWKDQLHWRKDDLLKMKPIVHFFKLILLQKAPIKKL